ncbi:MAG: hypothetical protein M3134_09915 [Actinomycetota bacterium]|nr:hypothetical protein [Actinomycetota bacterium]
MRFLEAACAVTLLLTGLPLPAAGQTRGDTTCLDVERELVEGRTDSPVFLVATIRRKVEGSDACNGKIVEKGRNRLISFELTGANDPDAPGVGSDSPESPDAACRVEVDSYTEARCAVALWGPQEGLQTVRAWIDDDGADPPAGVVEADRSEGADKSAEPGNGCVSPDSPLPSGDEPDCTDVVEIEWAERAPCEPDREPEGADGRIALVRYGGDVEEALYTIDHRGGSPQKIGAPEDLRDFLWSPDRRKLALTTGYMHRLELSVVRADGSGHVALTDDFMLDEGAAWSPDSRRLVFASQNYRKFESPNLKVVSAGGGKARWITRGSFWSTQPDWSPDGKRIVYARYDFAPTRSAIVTVAPDGSGRRALVSGDKLLEFPQFSPDGKEVLYRKYLEKGTEARELFVVDSIGRVRRLTRTGEVVAGFQWSPDGRKVVYETHSETGWNELRVVNANGSRDRLIVRHFGLYLWFSPSWSPDSSQLAYHLGHRPYDPDFAEYQSDVWVASLDGECAQAITQTPDVTEVAATWVTPAATSNPFQF